MKKTLLIMFALVLIITGALAFGGEAQARGRYGSIRIGGYNSHGKGSHYIGGYVRSCRGWSCYR